MKKRIMTVGDLMSQLVNYPEDMPICSYTGCEDFRFSSVDGIEVIESHPDLEFDIDSQWENPEQYRGKALNIG